MVERRLEVEANGSQRDARESADFDNRAAFHAFIIRGLEVRPFAAPDYRARHGSSLQRWNRRCASLIGGVERDGADS
jgi:hypothetical protein